MHVLPAFGSSITNKPFPCHGTEALICREVFPGATGKYFLMEKLPWLLREYLRRYPIVMGGESQFLSCCDQDKNWDNKCGI